MEAKSNKKKKVSGDSKKTLGVLTTGVVIGTTLGMLIASDKGKKTAKKIKNKAKSLVNDLQKKVNSRSNHVDDKS